MYDKYITTAQIKQYSDLNMVFIVNDKLITKAQVLKPNDNLTIRTDDGFIFDDFYPLYYVGELNIPYKFNLKSDKREWTINIQSILPYRIQLPVVIESNVNTLGVINKLFKLTRRQTHNLLHAYVEQYVPALNNQQDTFNFDQFINSLHVYPFVLPKEINSEVKEINLGQKRIGVDGTLLNTDQLLIEFDPIVMPGITDSVQLESEIELLLPFVDSIMLDPSDVFGGSIEVKMKVDLNSGETTYLVSSSRAGLLEMRVKKIGTAVPMSNTNIEPNKAILSGISSLSGVNDIYQPIVRVRNYINIEVANDFFGSYETKVGKLENEVGYFEINNINLSDVDLDLNIKEEGVLLRYLKDGIIIKKAA